MDNIKYSYGGAGAEKLLRPPGALSCHPHHTHDNTTVLGKHQESGYRGATLHVLYLRSCVILDVRIIPPKSGNLPASAILVL